MGARGRQKRDDEPGESARNECETIRSGKRRASDAYAFAAPLRGDGHILRLPSTPMTDSMNFCASAAALARPSRRSGFHHAPATWRSSPSSAPTLAAAAETYASASSTRRAADGADGVRDTFDVAGGERLAKHRAARGGIPVVRAEKLALEPLGILHSPVVVLDRVRNLRAVLAHPLFARDAPETDGGEIRVRLRAVAAGRARRRPARPRAVASSHHRDRGGAPTRNNDARDGGRVGPAADGPTDGGGGATNAARSRRRERARRARATDHGVARVVD